MEINKPMNEEEVGEFLKLMKHNEYSVVEQLKKTTFKQMNVELQTFKMSKDRSKQKICLSSTKIRWSLMMCTLELLQQSLENT